MKERPILFSGAMVRAVLEGRKTQTRRVVKLTDLERVKVPGSPKSYHISSPNVVLACPYGQLGDRLWVRENWSPDATRLYPCPPFWYQASSDLQSGSGHDCPPEHRGNYADCLACWEEQHGKFRWRPSIHMPRRVSRIDLEITGVRVERLQEISEADARAEGISMVPFYPDDGWPLCEGFMVGKDDGKSPLAPSAREPFQELWDSINGKQKLGKPDVSWEANPWVWVVEFKKVQP